MKILKQIPFYLLLIAVFFCLHGGVENFGSLDVREVFLCGVSVLLLIGIFFAVMLLFTRKMYPAALITFFISIWFFFFGAIHDFIKSTYILYPIRTYAVLIPLLLIFTVLWMIFIIKKKQLWVKLTLYLNSLLLIYCVIDAARLLYKIATVKKSQHYINFNYNAVTAKPDIFLLVFDGYPGQKSLKDSFNFSNEKMLSFLENASFKIIPSASNYNITQFSMASFFNMKYIDWNHTPVSQRDVQDRQNEINKAEVFSVFKKMGYKIDNNSIFDIDDIPGVYNANGFIMSHNFLLTDKIFINRLNRDIGGAIPLKIKKVFPFLRDISNETLRENNEEMTKQLFKTADKPQSSVPLFSYSHFLMPHFPYFFDSVGKAISPSVYNQYYASSNRQNFVSYLKYTNGILERMISAIKTKRPEAVIILMSDHGFRHFNEDNALSQPAHFNNIFAVKFPDGHYGQYTDSLTNVNFFRYIFNNQFGQKFQYLADSSINLYF